MYKEILEAIEKDPVLMYLLWNNNLALKTLKNAGIEIKIFDSQRSDRKK